MACSPRLTRDHRAGCARRCDRVPAVSVNFIADEPDVNWGVIRTIR